MATLQAAAPLVSKPLIGFTYRATVATFPGAFLLLVSAVALPCSCALLAVTWGLKGKYLALGALASLSNIISKVLSRVATRSQPDFWTPLSAAIDSNQFLAWSTTTA